MDDLISRQAAIRWIKTECNPYGKPTLDFESGKKVIEHLEQMPTSEPDTARAIATIIENEKDMRVIERTAEPRWIPVTERLPEKNKPVLVTHHGKHQAFVSVDWIDPYTHEWNRTCNVTAWMPLPKPCKGESDADD